MLYPKLDLANESAVVNLDDEKNSGTHWVACKKAANDVIYFDSFVNLRPLISL